MEEASTLAAGRPDVQTRLGQVKQYLRYVHLRWLLDRAMDTAKKKELTRELQYYWCGGPHKLHGPDGAVVEHVRSSGAFVKVPVPDGADGRAWHFTELALGHLWFFNAPNYLAASPEALLVPDELVGRDGLRPAGQSE